MQHFSYRKYRNFDYVKNNVRFKTLLYSKYLEIDFNVNCIPGNPIEQIIRAVVYGLKEAGEIILCSGETFGILLILEEQNICARNDKQNT